MFFPQLLALHCEMRKNSVLQVVCNNNANTIEKNGNFQGPPPRLLFSHDKFLRHSENIG